MTALGFIETKGLLAAIEGADAMLKAADVVLLEKNLAGGGLVTISVAGEVAAVKASVDAGVAAIRRIPGSILVSCHVIARPDAELERILAVRPPSGEGGAQEGDGPVHGRDLGDEAAGEETGGSEGSEAEGQTGELSSPLSAHELSQLKKMKVGRLRELAHTIQGFPMAGEEIDVARRKELIEALAHAYSQKEE